MIIVRGLVGAIDWLAEWVGKIVRWLAAVIMLSMAFEVTMRFAFNNPQIWSYDLTYMMGATLFLLPTAYVLLHGKHIRVDILYNRYSLKMQHIVDLAFILLLLFPASGVFVHQAWKYAIISWKQNEIAQYSFWEPTMIPIRFVVAFGFSLLALEVLSWFIRELYTLATGKSLVSGKERTG